MEPHKVLPDGIEELRPSFLNHIEYFKSAFVFANLFYKNEINKISSVNFEEITPDFFFLEYVWVVHATGFSAKAVGKFMPKLMEAYGPWEILANEEFHTAFNRIRLVCNNPQKSKAIHSTSKKMTLESWGSFKKNSLFCPEALSKLPYIGKTTCYHLGRNIGLLECVKPDLHLMRMAEYWGFKDCNSMCISIRDNTEYKLPLGIIDLILWYSASTFGTLEIRKEGSR